MTLIQSVRDHPWPALGVAVALGAAIGGSGADEKAVAATAGLVRGVARKTQSDDITADREGEARVESNPAPGLRDRLAEMVGSSVAGAFDRVLDEMRTASREWGARMRPLRPAAAAAVVAARTGTTTSPDDAVPVPNEIAPAELGLRADAVEALGGGTHEPPLEPGAGELGARWS